MMKPSHALVLIALLAPATRAQTSADPQAAIENWRNAHGPSWTSELDPRTGFVRSLYGGHTESTGHLSDDRGAFARARIHITSAVALTGISNSTLVEERALFLPLSSAGSSDKYTANFRQVVRGVPVVAATLHVLMDLEGRALSIESSAIPGAELALTNPTQDAARVALEAVRVFGTIAGVAGKQSGAPRLVLVPMQDQGDLRAVLAWEVDVFSTATNEVPRGLCLRLLDRDLSLADREELVHTCDVSGTVYTKLTPGVLPDLATNLPVQVPLAHVIVTSPQGNATTDLNGNFNIVGATAPLNVNVKYDGPFVTTTDASAPVYTLPANLPSASGNSIVMNSTPTQFYTGEANSMYWLGKLRDYIRAVNPGDATGDIDALSNCNLAQTCNAYFNGSSVNFFAAGGGCVNTAYSTVVAHEMGHWLNVVYGSGNGPDGFGEGNADNWATYLTDQPIVGENFFTNGGIIRTGLNTRTFCGDNAGGCYGEVHNDGEVLMGALWKVRTRLKVSLGNSAGAATADLLFNGWMNAYNDSTIKTIDRTHWLVLDDNDGDINNGTPHFNDINLGYGAQGFPLYVLTPVAISNVTVLPNTIDVVGPYVVNATAIANISPPLSTPQMFWRVNQGSFTAVTMSPLGANQFTATIPGQASPSKVEYYVSAANAVGTFGFSPSGAPATTNRFIVGEEQVYFSDTFDNTFSLWPTGATAGANDWQFGVPAGVGGDPAAPRTGQRCLGTDLGNPGFDGLYSANASNWAESPVINLSQCPRPILRLQRWLTIESALNDSARILVNGQVVWQHTGNSDLIDLGWTEVEYDITALAAGNPNTKIRFELSSNGSIQKGGWNIDDVQIVMVSAVGQGCLAPVSYCTGKLTSIGTLPYLTTLGAASESLNSLRVEIRDGASNKAGLLLVSAVGPASTPFNGGTLCLAPPVTRNVNFVMDYFGFASMAFPVLPGMAGQTWYTQAWFRDPPASFGVGLSNALRLKFCP